MPEFKVLLEKPLNGLESIGRACQLGVSPQVERDDIVVEKFTLVKPLKVTKVNSRLP